MECHQAADHEGPDEQQQVQNLLAAEAHAALDETLQLAERNSAAAEGDSPNDAADDREHRCRVTIHLAAVELHRRDGSGSAATHAVIQSDHLRHVGDGNTLAAPPGISAA